ncbi:MULTISPECIES: hypothetical protein [Acetobacter]|uniref:hypothetical protein n=1 Tax=Acetobacter TaxID=434 RepID=UPI00376F5011
MKFDFYGSIIETKIFSDSEYNNLVCEIYIDGVYICLLSTDDGIDKISIVFPDCEEKCKKNKVRYDIFVFALSLAKKDILNKRGEESNIDPIAAKPNIEFALEKASTTVTSTTPEGSTAAASIFTPNDIATVEVKSDDMGK